MSYWRISIVAAVNASEKVYVADGGNRRIQKLDSTGTFIASWNDRAIEMIFTETISGIIRRYCRVRPE